MTPRNKILWLVSWYPNRKDRFDGDFIQRHAHAAAIEQDIHVLYLTDLENLTEGELLNDTHYATGLTEQLVYYKTPSGPFRKIYRQLRWYRVFKKIITDYIVKFGPPDLVHVHIPWKSGLLALWLKKKKNLPFIVTEHWGIYNDTVTDHFKKKSLFLQRAVKKIIEEAEFIISVSEYVANGIKKIAEPKQVYIIPNVVDTSLFYYKEKSQAETFTFIHVSNMVPLKNVEGILRAFFKISRVADRPVRLILIGNRNDYYLTIAQEFGMLNKTVFFKGELPYRDVAHEMQSAHCLVQNSIMENAPCVISEALCCGLPLITTNVGGIPEMVDASNSLTVPINDPDNLAIKMLQMMEQYDYFSREGISKNAIAKYGFANIIEQFSAIYKNAIRNRV